MTPTEDPSDAVAVAMGIASTLSDLPFGLITVRQHDGPVADFEIRWLNRTASEMFGRDAICPGALLRRDLARVVDPEMGHLIEQAMRGGRVVTAEIDQASPEGPRRLRCVLMPVEGGAFVMLDDISEHHRARDELASAERKLAQLQDWGRVGFWELDIETNEAYWSTQAFQIIGHADASLRAFLDVVHPDDRELIRHVTERARAQPGPYRATHRVLFGDDVRVLQHNMQSVAGDDGRPVRLLGMVTDVTGEHALEDRMQRASAQQSIGLLAGGMVHDLNNTFSVVHGHAQLAMMMLDRGRPVDRQHLEAIQRSVESARALTRQLLSLGREQVLCPRRFSPLELLERTAVVARATLGSRRTVDVDVGDDQIDLVADPGGVERLLIDLVINARDALPADGGRVGIELNGIQLDEAAELVVEGTLAPGFYAEIAVTDDGSGMDEETLDRAFEPFFSTKAADEGSGVGLASANRFALQSGGALVATSTVGHGTRVAVILPAVCVASEVGARRNRPRRVLVAMADADAAERLQRAFASTSIQTVVATSLGAAVTVLRTEPIDLVVADAVIGVPLESSPTWRASAGSGGATMVVLTAPESIDRPSSDSVIVLDEPGSDADANALAAELLSAVGT